MTKNVNLRFGDNGKEKSFFSSELCQDKQIKVNVVVFL